MSKKPTAAPALCVDPLLVEEVVWGQVWTLDKRLSVEGFVQCPDLTPFHQEREAIYQNFPLEERERAFREFYERWFDQLGFHDLMEKIVIKFPLLTDSSVTVLLRRAASRQEEKGQLYKEGNEIRAVIGIQPSHALDRQWLEHFLRTELLCLSDILDPVFQYSPDPDFGGASELENNFIRERFCLLWEESIQQRLRQKDFTQRCTQADLIQIASQRVRKNP